MLIPVITWYWCCLMLTRGSFWHTWFRTWRDLRIVGRSLAIYRLFQVLDVSSFQVLCAIAFLQDTAIKTAQAREYHALKRRICKVDRFRDLFKERTGHWRNPWCMVRVRGLNWWIHPSNSCSKRPANFPTWNDHSIIRNTDVWPPLYWSLESRSNFSAVLHCPG